VVRDTFTRSGATESALRFLYERQVHILGIDYNRMKSLSFSNSYPQYYNRESVRDLSKVVHAVDA
jgi:hypothetical protein